jgi:hypothetical protein
MDPKKRQYGTGVMSVGEPVAFEPVSARERLLAVGEALTRLDSAIESLVAASKKANTYLPAEHPVPEEIATTLRGARAARAKLELALRRCP